MQNDDWFYYAMVQDFLRGNFVLHANTGPIFYTQGVISMIFAAVFGLTKLPVLTLLISVLNFYIFQKILSGFLKVNTIISVLLGILFFLNPFHIYSILGIMTENYFLFFTLLNIYFALDYFERGGKKSFILNVMFFVLAFFIRQIAVITSLSVLFSLFIKKKYKEAIIQLAVMAVVGLYYVFLFPKTAAMNDKQIDLFYLFTNPRGVYSMGYVIMIYLAASLLPLVLLIPFKTLLKRPKKVILQDIGIFLATFILLNLLFTPKGMPHNLFPYLDNTWYSRGFYQAMDGTKYDFLGMSYFYKLWDFLARMILAAIPLILIRSRSKLLNLYTFYILISLSLLMLMNKVYDRYILMLVPFAMLLSLSLKGKNSEFTRIFKYSLGVFVAFLFFYNYQFSLEFVTLNNYLWERSQQIAEVNKLPPDSILSSYTWNKIYVNRENYYKYKFTFNPVKNNNTDCCWKLLETKKIEFPLSIYQNAVVYLYQRF